MFVTDVDSMTCTSLLIRPKEDTVSLVKANLGRWGMMKESSTPDSHEVNPDTLPTEPFLELYHPILQLWFIQVNGEIMVIGPVATYT